MAPPLDRAQLFEDPSVNGIELSRAYCSLMDDWLRALYRDASSGAEGVALVAVGGYGRGELAPQSDLDVVLVSDEGTDLGTLPANVWYPLWDSGASPAHAVRTMPEMLAAADADLKVALGLLDLRHL